MRQNCIGYDEAMVLPMEFTENDNFCINPEVEQTTDADHYDIRFNLQWLHNMAKKTRN